MKNAISRFGKFLSGMVMPNIGAFIAWGFLTALFIEKGWFPNERLSSMVSPMLSYLLPILIAGQGGYMVAKERGRVIACIAVIGCICGSDYTMLMGAMVMGPLAGWVIKQFDNRVGGAFPPVLKCWSGQFLHRHPRHAAGDPRLLRYRPVYDRHSHRTYRRR